MSTLIKQTVSLASSVFLPVSGVQSEPSAYEIRDALREWVRLEALISSEASEWSAEKQILADRISLLESEEAYLHERLRQADSEIGELERRRSDLDAQRESLKSLTETLIVPLSEFEEQLLRMYPTFPEPLQEETRRLRDRIPADSETTRLSVPERLLTVVGILSFADKFNSGVQREVEIRMVDGQQVEVETLYFGLGGAYYADATGRHCGTGVPGPGGWVWRSTPESAQQILRLHAVYAGTREADFSTVPVTIPHPSTSAQ